MIFSEPRPRPELVGAPPITNGSDVVTRINAVPAPSLAPRLGGGDTALLQGGTLIGSVSRQRRLALVEEVVARVT